MAEIFQNKEQNYQHVGKCMTSHAILLHRKGFTKSHHGIAALQFVARPCGK